MAVVATQHPIPIIFGEILESRPFEMTSSKQDLV